MLFNLFYFSDCVQVIANPGTYVVQARHGSNAPCGVYIAGLHNEIINVEISLVDVTCKTGGLMAVRRKFILKHRIYFLSVVPSYDYIHSPQKCLGVLLILDLKWQFSGGLE